MINVEKNMTDSVPVFVPPRKRQTSKKQNGVQNYVDHIVTVQVCKNIEYFEIYLKSSYFFSQMTENTQYHQVWMICWLKLTKLRESKWKI